MSPRDPGKGFTVLLVDDEPNYRASFRRLLKPEGCLVLEAGSGAAALEIMAAHRVDAALVDVRMPGMDGLELLEQIRSRHRAVKVIMLTAQAGLPEAVRAIQAGAADFLEKDAATETVLARLGQVRRIWELERDNSALREQSERSFDFDALVGGAPAMMRLKEAIVRVGPSDASVLVEGETGTGKELVARAIHHHSRRGDGPLVAVDCASISESLMESELFGHLKGSFTGAQSDKVGLVRSADHGTVFLDEIGELPAQMQSKLLRVIQEREVRPVGGERVHRVDIRVIAATNRRLPDQVAKSLFREDLYYRLAVVTLEVPPLRSRREDIPSLAQCFLERFRSPDSGVREINSAALACLASHSWPGNVRELRNVIERAVALGSGPELLPEDLPEAVRCPAPSAQDAGKAAEGDSMDAYERAAIVNALKKTGGSRREAAKLLRVGEATLYRKLHQYGLG
jgi:DNA-binding NtrC family response regulator